MSCLWKFILYTGGCGTMKHSRYEKETIVNYNAGEQTAAVYTRDKAALRNLTRLLSASPKSYVNYRKPGTISKEQRERARQMMIKQNLMELSVQLW